MRRLIWIFASLALVWSGWWFAASTGLQRGVDLWLEDRRSEGWQADASSITGGGFPLTLRAVLADLALADPETGVALRTDMLEISAPTWWPGDVTVRLDDDPIRFASPYATSQLVMADGVMKMELRPGSALELEALGWTAGPWQVSDTGGTRAEAQDLTLTMRQVDGAAYAFEARAEQFEPGVAARRLFEMPDGVPKAFDSLQVTASVTFDRPWDRRALNERRPQPRRVTVPLAEAKWGDLSLNFACDLVVDDNGVPEGTVSLQAKNWQAMLDIAVGTGMLPERRRRQAENVLRSLARATGNEQTLDVELEVRGGLVVLGFVPISSAPRLILR